MPVAPDAFEPSENDALIQIAIAMVEQGGVDWNEILRSPLATDSGDLRDLIERLRVVDRIVSGHDTLQSPRPATAVSAAQSPHSTVTERRNLAEVRWGPLVVREKIGSGSFGSVYRAWDPRLARDVALKIIDDDQAEPDAVVEEARTLARVHHPNVIAVHGAERIDGRIGIWMEFVQGRSLAAVVADSGPLSPEAAAFVGIDVCRALAAVHGAGLLHRDIKAQNVVRATTGRVVLSDFGTSVDPNESGEFTRRRLVGTPLYLAPELFHGAPASIQSDLYSLGVLLYFLMTGAFPVSGRTSNEIRRAHAEGGYVPLRTARGAVPLSLARVVERLLDSAPTQRFPSAETVTSELSAWLHARSQPWAKRHAVALTGAALLAVATMAWTGIPGVWGGFVGSGGPVIGGPSARLIERAPCQGPPTADGEWIACVINDPARQNEPRAQRLVMFGIRTGETRELWRTANTEQPLRSATISPDGRYIASAVPTPSSNGQPREIRVFDIGAGDWRTIATLPPDTFSMSIGAWSGADDRLEVYVLRRGMSSFAFALVSPRTGEIDIAFEFPVMPTNWWRSADGRWLTYGSPDREIRVCDLQSRDARSRECGIVAPHPATDFLSFFSPDGSLLFSSDRGGTIALWRVELDGIRQEGTPRLVRDTGRERLVPIAFSERGDLFYRLEVGAPDVLQVDLAAGAAQVRGSMTPPIRVSRSPAWSNDGSRLAYVASLGNHTGGGAVQLVVQSVPDGTERAFDLAGAQFNSARTAWAPDDRALAIRSIVLGEGGGEIAIRLVDPQRGLTGKVLRRLAPEEKSLYEQIGDVAWVDAGTIAFSKARGVGTFDVESGQEGSLWMADASETVVNLAVSPDRAWLALTVQRADGRPSIRIVPVRAAKSRQPMLHHNAAGWVQSWFSNGAILVTRSEKAPTGEGIGEVWRVPTDGTEPTRVPVVAQGLYEVRAHPDGHRLAISTHALRSEFFVGLGR